MKKIVLLSLALIGMSTINAQQADTTRTHRLSEVVVNAIRAKKNAPFAVANINRNDLAAFSKTGQELPFLFAQTPESWHGAKTEPALAPSICVCAELPVAASMSPLTACR
jgi:hypothetical protein